MIVFAVLSWIAKGGDC